METNKISKIIGTKIQEARLVKGYTQERLAEKCNISTHHISAIENGRSCPSVPVLLSICETLDISTNFIFDGILASKNDSINSMDTEVLLTYLKLQDESKDYINDTITFLYNLQKKR